MSRAASRRRPRSTGTTQDTTQGTAQKRAREAPRDPGPVRSRRQRLVATVDRVAASRWPLTAWFGLVLAGLAALVCGILELGPAWLPGAGSVAVVSGYTWALAARTGGRPVVFGSLALVLGVVVLVLDDDRLRTGAAAWTCVVAAVLAVMGTIPARRFRHAVREGVLAVLVAAIGALAVVGFEPVISVVRFEYATLGLSLVGVFTLVFRLGAGFHGLGRRGLLIVVVGGAVLLLTLAYAELLRRYGPGEVVTDMLDLVRWSRENLGAFPRPIATVLGVPALVWGCHMRARRRQGWWVTAFGVAATASVASSMMNPAIALLEVGLSTVYGLGIGLVIGFVLIRLDLRLTGPRGRRARRAEERAAGRPEPARGQALL